MTTYVYESVQGDRVERDFRIGKAPKRVKQNSRWYHRIICAPGFRIEKVEGIHSPGRVKHAVRNMHDIRNIEAMNPGLKFDPDLYERNKDVPMPDNV